MHPWASRYDGTGNDRLCRRVADLEPDLLLILGDRFEAFSMAACAMVARIPIAHLHGGETTEGVIDNQYAIALAMAHLHFVAAEEYRNRVIQLGEQPKSVFNVGALRLITSKS